VREQRQRDAPGTDVGRWKELARAMEEQGGYRRTPDMALQRFMVMQGRTGRWTPEEDQHLREAMRLVHGSDPGEGLREFGF
jgi:hypothetical protein